MDEAVALQEEAFAIGCRVLRPDHPNVVEAMEQMAAFYERTGRKTVDLDDKAAKPEVELHVRASFDAMSGKIRDATRDPASRSTTHPEN